MVRIQSSTAICSNVHDDGALVLGLSGTDKPFYASIGPGRGPLIYSEAVLAIAVTKRWRGRVPVGTALCVGRDRSGVALWELTVGKYAMPGRWVVIDREFRRPESTPR
jgi:hypothetical protein